MRLPTSATPGIRTSSEPGRRYSASPAVWPVGESRAFSKTGHLARTLRTGFAPSNTAATSLAISCAARALIRKHSPVSEIWKFLVHSRVRNDGTPGRAGAGSLRASVRPGRGAVTLSGMIGEMAGIVGELPSAASMREAPLGVRLGPLVYTGTAACGRSTRSTVLDYLFKVRQVDKRERGLK